jgi:sugar/nucleoside kinase (ribokinase family)
VKLSQKGKKYTNASNKIDKVMDSTGAGDAFGLDFICFIKEKLLMSVWISKLAALKLQNVGRLPDNQYSF